MSENLAENLGRLAAQARAQAEDRSRHGDEHGDWYARGLRDGYSNAAVAAAQDARQRAADEHYHEGDGPPGARVHQPCTCARPLAMRRPLCCERYGTGHARTMACDGCPQLAAPEPYPSPEPGKAVICPYHGFQLGITCPVCIGE